MTRWCNDDSAMERWCKDTRTMVRWYDGNEAMLYYTTVITSLYYRFCVIGPSRYGLFLNMRYLRKMATGLHCSLQFMHACWLIDWLYIYGVLRRIGNILAIWRRNTCIKCVLLLIVHFNQYVCLVLRCMYMQLEQNHGIKSSCNAHIWNAPFHLLGMSCNIHNIKFFRVYIETEKWKAFWNLFW